TPTPQDTAGGTPTPQDTAGGTPAPQLAVSGTHSYQDEGQYTISVSVSQNNDPSVASTVTTPANIHEQLLAEGTVGTADQNNIQESYRDLFDRQAEPTGRQDWVGLLESGVPRVTVAYEMIKVATSEEFQIDTVSALYQQYLHRAPDPMGETFWVAYLYSGGGTIEGMAEALIGSNEYYQSRGDGTVSGFLHALFADTLGRDIDSGALTYFTGLMANGRTTDEIATMIFLSDEYQRVRVNDLYEQLLDRPADPAGLAYFAAELAWGVTDESIMAQMLSSDEYFAKAQI
ncbi:MAG: DUF4214 domain-containing protein, partial [Pirellulales bacterium]